MPAIPSVNETVRDFGLGIIAPAVMTPIGIGVCSAGSFDELVFYSEITTLRTERGEGPLVEWAAHVLANGGGPVGICRADPSVAASNGSVTKDGTGGDVTVSGDATLDAHVLVEIIVGGDNGVATFRYSCDGYSGDTAAERTYSEVLTVPSGGTFVIPNLGITLTFDDSTPFVAGDSYTVDVECAALNSSDLGDCFTGITASAAAWRFASLITSKANGDETAHATLAASFQSQLNTLASSSKYRRGMMPADAGESAAADVATAFAATVATRLLIAFGMVRRATVKTFPGFGFPVTHSLDVFSARAAASLPSTDLKRVRSGPHEGVVKIFHDERASPSTLDDVKVSTMRTWEELEGFYITQGRLKSPSGSDFKLWPMGLVMDIACETVHAELIFAIGQGVRYNPNGSIDERDAIAIEEGVAQALIAQLKSPTNAEGFEGHVQDVRFRINRSHNVRDTGTIMGTVGIKPLGYVDYVETDLGFVVDIPLAA